MKQLNPDRPFGEYFEGEKQYLSQGGMLFDPATKQQVPDTPGLRRYKESGSATLVDALGVPLAPSDDGGDAAASGDEVNAEDSDVDLEEGSEVLECKFCGKQYKTGPSPAEQKRAATMMEKHLNKEHQDQLNET
jgi:hypothetical protein